MRVSFVLTAAMICVSPIPVAASWFYITSDVGIAAELVGTDLVSGIGANRTYRIWAVMPEDWRVDAVAGNSTTSMRFEVVGGTFYQNEWGGPTSTSINAGFFSLAPELEWDSYLTIGSLDSDGTPFDNNELLDLGIDWTAFEASGNLLETSNGSVFVLPTDMQGELVAFTDACGTAGNGVLIAQLTLVGEEASLEGSVLLQGHDDQGQVFQSQIDSFSIDADGVSDALPQIACAADITGDDRVDVMDLLHLLGHWYDGSCEDITRDLVVDGADVLLLVDSWGSCSGE
ncbi:MAG: hypothetical protein QF471_08360 [Phycisphaerales bacterium]|jgi:hypothetical protein|nr:hypothetical protein [Phycisphaerales bacterium]